MRQGESAAAKHGGLWRGSSSQADDPVFCLEETSRYQRSRATREFIGSDHEEFWNLYRDITKDARLAGKAVASSLCIVPKHHPFVGTRPRERLRTFSDDNAATPTGTMAPAEMVDVETHVQRGGENGDPRLDLGFLLTDSNSNRSLARR